MALSSNGGAKHHNVRKWMFYAAEIIFAVIAGTGEASIYYAYTAPGPWRWPEALARAFVTQVAIIFFGIAAVQATESVRKFWQKFLAALPANVATGVFSLVAFWFIRDAAIVFRDGSVLGPAENVTYVLPNGYALTGQTIDVYLIASLPLFQVGLNWLSPLITREKTATYESEEQRRQREQNEIADVEHKARLAALKAGNLATYASAARAAGKALFSKPDEHDDAGSPAENTVDTSGRTTPTAADESGAFGAASRPSQPAQRGDPKMRLVPSGVWTAADLCAYVGETYGVELKEQRAKDVISAQPDKVRLPGRGQPYGAPKRALRTWADKEYRARLSDTNDDGTSYADGRTA